MPDSFSFPSILSMEKGEAQQWPLTQADTEAGGLCCTNKRDFAEEKMDGEMMEE